MFASCHRDKGPLAIEVPTGIQVFCFFFFLKQTFIWLILIVNSLGQMKAIYQFLVVEHTPVVEGCKLISFIFVFISSKIFPVLMALPTIKGCRWVNNSK